MGQGGGAAQHGLGGQLEGKRDPLPVVPGTAWQTRQKDLAKGPGRSFCHTNAVGGEKSYQKVHICSSRAQDIRNLKGSQPEMQISVTVSMPGHNCHSHRFEGFHVTRQDSVKTHTLFRKFLEAECAVNRAEYIIINLNM